jgi:hypothetical protein
VWAIGAPTGTISECHQQAQSPHRRGRIDPSDQVHLSGHVGNDVDAAHGILGACRIHLQHGLDDERPPGAVLGPPPARVPLSARQAATVTPNLLQGTHLRLGFWAEEARS